MAKIKEAAVVKQIKTVFKTVFKNPDITKVYVTPMHNRGFPDLLISTDLGVFFIEVKAPGNKPTRLQSAKLNSLKEGGQDSVFCYWVDCDPVEPNLLRFYCPKTNKLLGRLPVK